MADFVRMVMGQSNSHVDVMDLFKAQCVIMIYAWILNANMVNAMLILVTQWILHPNVIVMMDTLVFCVNSIYVTILYAQMVAFVLLIEMILAN